MSRTNCFYGHIILTGDIMPYSKKFKRRRKAVFLLIAFVILLIVSYFVIDSRIHPVLSAMAESRAKNIASEAVNDAVRKVLCEKNLRYENLVELTKDESGTITAVTVDSVKINQLCAEIRGIITDTLNNLGEKTFSIPVGSLTGVDVLSGRGPRLNIGITLSGSAVTKIDNDFQTAGINQTRHQMILHVDTKIYVIMQSGNISAEISNSIVVAETVIVGQVPEIYSDGSSDLWQNLMGYE